MLIRDAIFNVIDTETTGLDPKKDQVCSVASVRCSLRQGIISQFSTLVDPHTPIPPEASAIHHITDRHVAGKPALAEALRGVFQGGPGPVPIPVAHNAAFDSAFLPPIRVEHTDTGEGWTEYPWLCTLRLSRKLWPDLAKHTNQFLRYHLALECPEAEGLPAHDALADALVTAKLLLFQLSVVLDMAKDRDAATVEALINWTNKPALLNTCRFGNKHNGKKWSEVPRDYLQWMMDKVTNMDDDTTFTVRHYLGMTNQP